MTDPCLFCRIVARDIPATIVGETEDCIAFRDITPQAPVHVLVIPKRHIASLADADDPALIGQLSLMAARVAVAEGVGDGGYRTVVNTGRDAGQTVSHLHLHLLAGRAMSWPPG